MAKTKRTNSVLQNIAKKIKDQQGTHTNPGMTFGGRKNVCHWTESHLIGEIGKNW